MSSNESAAPLSIEPGNPAVIALVSAGIHALAGVSVWLAPLGVPLTLVVALGCGLSLWRDLRTNLLLKGPRAVRRITWQPGRGWRLADGTGSTRAGSLQPSSFVAPWLLVLNWATAAGFSTVILHPGNSPEPLRRRLAAGFAAGRAAWSQRGSTDRIRAGFRN